MQLPRKPHPATPDVGVAKGRGSGINPTGRFETLSLTVLNEHLEEQARERIAEGKDPDAPVQVRTTVLADASRSVLNRVDSPDLPFSWSVNPYRGCEHGCIYCYARPTHEYFGLSCGLDFETKIVAKPDAPRLLRKALTRPSWTGEPVVMSGVTDPYQPIERELRITRGCIEVLHELGQSVSLITKNHLITRDIDLLAAMARDGRCHAAVSVTSLDNVLASKMEPRASSPRDRLSAIRELSAAGIPVTVMTAPIIPGLNDKEIPAILEAARDAGAMSAGWVMLRLPWQVKDLFLDWLVRHFPDRAAHVESLIRQTRGGLGGSIVNAPDPNAEMEALESHELPKDRQATANTPHVRVSGKLYDSTYFKRQRGDGPVSDTIAQVFRLYTVKLGLNKRETSLRWAGRKPRETQMGLFE